jgi:hypothetical protein
MPTSFGTEENPFGALRGSSDRVGAGGFDRDSSIGGAFDVDEGPGPARIRVPYFGNCTRPIGLAHPLGRDVEYGVRCRNCPGCLRARSYLWRLRAEAETLQSAGSFLFTGTYRDQYHDLEPVAESVTLWLKRLRSFVPSQSVRYLVSYERHRSGAWHIHALLHDVEGRASHVQHMAGKAWRDGFWDCKPVNISGAGYVAKYVSKDLGSSGPGARRPRLRASRSPTYGDCVMQHEEEIVRELQKRKYDWGNVYRLNLLDVLQWSQVDKNGDTWKQLVRSQQTSGKLLLNTVEVKPSGRKQVKITAEVDRETGEILPYGKVS